MTSLSAAPAAAADADPLVAMVEKWTAMVVALNTRALVDGVTNAEMQPKFDAESELSRSIPR